MPEMKQIDGHKLHPSGLLIGFITGLPQLIFPILALCFGARNAVGDGILIYVVFAVLLVSTAVQAIFWLRFSYYIGEDNIRIESGLFSRTSRSIPYDRIQDVSIEEKMLARVFDLAEVKFDTGGGGKGDDDAKLTYVLASDAVTLREMVRSRKFALAKDDGESAASSTTEIRQESEDKPIFIMDNRRLVTLGSYSFSLVIFAVLGGLAHQFDFLLPFKIWDLNAWIRAVSYRGVSIGTIGTTARYIGAAIAILALIPLGMATGIASTFLREYGFRLDLTPKGFRRRRGLLNKTDVVMPVGRVQATLITTGPIRKWRGWYALQFISMAKEGKKGRHYVAAPLANLEEIWPIVAITGVTPPTPDTAFENSPYGPWFDTWMASTLIIGIIFSGLHFTFDIRAYWSLLVIALSALISYLGWRREMHAINNDQIFSRHGWWNEHLTIARKSHVQTITISQGPISRLRGLARVDFGIAGGHLAFRYIPMQRAKMIRDQVMNIASPIDFSALDSAKEEYT
jgi:putative membrane protein